MNVAQIISAKRDGNEISTSEIEYLVNGFTAGVIPDYQMSAFAMAVFFQGMTFRETVDLTRSMRDTGAVLAWQNGPTKVDKHSTGGVGDKISIPLAPALAACGVNVPMVSGRGLGPTGGTLDKLESIPGFRCNLSTVEFQRVSNDVGCVISGATANIAPADQKLYALRDVTGTVPSIPLITASILSKKLAAGLDALVLDVKWGSGAFMKTIDNAMKLAESLVKVANELGTTTTAIITDMNQPLGRMVGNAVEIEESIEILNGRGPADVLSLTLELGGQVLFDSGNAPSIEHGRERISQTLGDQSAMQKFRQMVSAQNGDPDKITKPEASHGFTAEAAGYVNAIDCEKIGLAIIEMGGGRKTMTDSINPATGIEIQKRIGERVEAGELICSVYSNRGISPIVESLLRQSFSIGQKPADAPPLIVATVKND